MNNNESKQVQIRAQHATSYARTFIEHVISSCYCNKLEILRIDSPAIYCSLYFGFIIQKSERAAF